MRGWTEHQLLDVDSLRTKGLIIESMVLERKQWSTKMVHVEVRHLHLRRMTDRRGRLMAEMWNGGIRKDPWLAGLEYDRMSD